MLEKIGPVSNPLTIIAIFAGIAEVSGTLILPFISVSSQETYIWFLMFFPTLLLICFFFVLYTKHVVYYAPSDFRDDEAFEKLAKDLKEVDEHVKKLDEQIKSDLEAITLVKRILYQLPEDRPINQTEIDKKICKASEEARAQIYFEAADIRFQNWRNYKPVMERTIPIFRALIASDTENKNHRNHGNLGFALKDESF
ncbi:hypothetical protein MSLAZ_0794 [Methanosarcina lacustris Z-7289]|uniref:Uncharacterized protein n=1 Tax=Methanosarcina lacustris Z-7289 TaxID=1434111 RepID=A0A0E3WS39_9EURY|nr:hypothetical protein [Methanosarcina lacustris]AKB74055.1 hypothetical protein MSLAZ_0794 [Methanosarcina lacustris Z-7289]